jgi:hypothetical protein
MKKLFDWIHKSPYFGLAKMDEMNAAYALFIRVFLILLFTELAYGISEVRIHGILAKPSPSARFVIASTAIGFLAIGMAMNFHYKNKNEEK